MNEHRTTSTILQRVAVILAVTAASYGLPSQAQSQPAQRDGKVRHAVAGTATATALERMREDVALHD